MKHAFLKTSPKYAGIAAGLLVTPIGFTTATAAIVGGLFAKQIFKKRREKNLTQEQLAEKLSVSNKTISKWENGVSKTKGY